MALLDNAGICASKGSACLGNSDGVSHVISAMKVGDLTARQSLRFSLGFGSTQGDVSESVSTLIRNVAALRA